MKIEFYNKDTGKVIPDAFSMNYLFVMNNEVYADNLKTYESHSSVVSFDNFITVRADLAWRVVE